VPAHLAAVAERVRECGWDATQLTDDELEALLELLLEVVGG
jgi:hypothetical protein